MIENMFMYDLKDFDPEKRKVIAKTLRFVSHTHGAVLQVGIKIKISMEMQFNIDVFISAVIFCINCLCKITYHKCKEM